MQVKNLPEPWFGLPALRCLTASSPAYARGLKGLPGVRPWNRFLAATVIGRKPGESERRTAVVVTPFEADPEKRNDLTWRRADTGELLVLGEPDSDGVRWHLRTLLGLRRMAPAAVHSHVACYSAARSEMASRGSYSKNQSSLVMVRAMHSPSYRRKRSSGGSHQIRAARPRCGIARSDPPLS
jgi:hypothetical protein